MSQNERIKELRKYLKLSMEEFGKRLGVGKTAISKIESGENNVSDQMCLSVCNVYHINETWLRTGEGDMFVPDPKDELEALKRKYNLTSWAIKAIERFCTLDPKSQDIILCYMESVVDAIREESQTNAASDVTEQAVKRVSEMTDDEIHSRALEIEDQLRVEKTLTDTSSPSKHTKKA